MITLDKPVSWQDVLVAKKLLGYVGILAALAKDAGYPYILWNDRVWTVNPLEMTDVTKDQILPVDVQWVLDLTENIYKELEWASIDIGPWGYDLIRMSIIKFITKGNPEDVRLNSDSESE